ncbi:hypothetical protein, partial [Streptomyces rochei]|uniref:hypothetical protein n=1 Tax=Streptomyces rochei TaxID=1928 RepID=UPI0036608E06
MRGSARGCAFRRPRSRPRVPLTLAAALLLAAASKTGLARSAATAARAPGAALRSRGSRAGGSAHRRRLVAGRR